MQTVSQKRLVSGESDMPQSSFIESLRSMSQPSLL